MLTINKERCKGCALCIQVCPKRCLEMSCGVNSKGVQYALLSDRSCCISCGRCYLICPDLCIEING